MTLEELEKQAKALRNQFTTAANAIAKDPDLTSAAKQRRIKELREQHAQQMADLRRQVNETIEAERRRLRRKAFGVEAGRHDSIRTALAAADQAKSQDALLRMLERADATGDEMMARAVAMVASERGYSRVLDEFVKYRPSYVGKALDELASFERRMSDPNTKFALSVVFSAAPAPKDVQPGGGEEIPL